MQQQNQSKLGFMKPTKVGVQGTSKLSQRDAYAKFLNMPKTKNAKSFGVGWGGEKPIKTVSPKKKPSLPSKTRVMNSLKKTMGY